MKLQGYELIRANLNNSIPSTNTTQETLRAIECIQDIISFWYPDNAFKNALAIRALEARIRESSSECQAKQLTALLYAPILSSTEYDEVAQQAIDSIFKLLMHLQSRTEVERVRTLSL
jgi:hypothetical protein